MRCTLEWSPSGHQYVCISYSQLDIRRQLKKTLNRRCSQLYRYLSYKSHSSFKPTCIFFEDFVCVLQMILLKKKKSMLVLGLDSINRKFVKVKANIGNPKVNRGCPHSLPTALQQTVMKIHLDPQYNIFHWGSTILGVSTLWLSLWQCLAKRCKIRSNIPLHA